jgi:hypothetical protein
MTDKTGDLPKPGNAVYEEHASPQAIQAHLMQARTKRRRVVAEYDKTISWLEELLLDRTQQVADGQWPRKDER